MKSGVVTFVLGTMLLGFGVFSMFYGDVARIAYFVGLVLLVVAIAQLIWSGWHGRRASWPVGALAAAIVTWTIYELVRQTPPYPDVGFLETYTAPLISSVAAALLLAIGLWRTFRSSAGQES
jgi:hypothetical protein